MKLKVVVGLAVLCVVAALSAQAQVRVGSPEYKLFEHITAEKDPDTKLGLVASFETQFPQSKILANVYLVAVEVYREKNDRQKINEYGEKVLKVDGTNITALMLLARSYAIETKNLGRAVELAQQAVDRVRVLRTEPQPAGYSAAQWSDYLRTTEQSADQILRYVNSVKGHTETVRSVAGSTTSDPKP